MPARYAERAEECVRLAAIAQDEMIRAELLRLRQTYLNVAAKLTNPPRDDAPSRKPSPNH